MSNPAIGVCEPAKKRNHRNSVLKELRAMEIVAYEHIQDEETKPSDVAQLMRAYVACEQQRNVLKMRPAPKAIDVTKLPRRKNAAQALVDDTPA